MNPKLKLLAGSQGGVYSRAQAGECGYTPDQIRERLADGRWERIRHGQYAEAVDVSHLAPWDQEAARHRRLIHGVMNSMRPGTVAVSHQSALALHDVPLWGPNLAEVQLNRLDRHRGGRVAGVRHHRGKLTPEDLTSVSGLPVTTVSRALFEMACTTSFEAAVISADAARRRRLINSEEADRLLEVTEFWPGSATARAAWRYRLRCRGSPYPRSLPAPSTRGLPTRIFRGQPPIRGVIPPDRGFARWRRAGGPAGQARGGPA